MAIPQIGQTVSGDQFKNLYPVGAKLSADQFKQTYPDQQRNQATQLPNNQSFVQKIFAPDLGFQDVGVKKNANGTFRGPTFAEGLGQAAIGAGKTSIDTVKSFAKMMFENPETFTGQMKQIASLHPEFQNMYNQAENFIFNKGLNSAISDQNLEPTNQAQLGGGIAEKAAEVLVPVGYEAATGKFSPAVSEAAQGIKSGVSKAVSKISSLGSGDTPEALAGRVTGATGNQVPAATRTLDNIGYEGEKDPKVVLKKINQFIADTSKNIDTRLGASNKTFTATDIQKLNPTSLKSDYVGTALKNLEEMYGKTANPDAEFRILQLQEKYAKEGLTPKEINDIAREYGQVKSGFNLNGQPSTSVNKQMYENVRTGVKNTARLTMPDAGTQELDKQISDAITTRDLMTKQVKSVQKAANKVTPPGAIQKGAKFIKKAATVGAVGGGVDYLLKKTTGLGL